MTWGKASNVPALLALLVAAGCSTPDLNPPAPRASTGYVDFYTASNEVLSWDVKREESGNMRSVFCDYKPLSGNILRLAAPAGTNRFEVWFNNETTTGPQTVEVRVENAKVTPVQVTLAPTGTTSVDRVSYEYRATARATRRVTKLVSGEQQVFEIGLAPANPREYQAKEWMPYFCPRAK